MIISVGNVVILHDSPARIIAKYTIFGEVYLDVFIEPAVPPTNTHPPATAVPLPTNTPAPTAVPTEPPAPTQPPPPSSSLVEIINVNKQEEFLDLRNNNAAAIDLSGWVLVSEKGNQACGLGGVMQPDATLRIYALAEDAGKGGYNCNFGSPIWNNSEPDPAVLYDNTGAEVDRW